MEIKITFDHDSHSLERAIFINDKPLERYLPSKVGKTKIGVLLSMELNSSNGKSDNEISDSLLKISLIPEETRISSVLTLGMLRFSENPKIRNVLEQKLRKISNDMVYLYGANYQTRWSKIIELILKEEDNGNDVYSLYLLGVLLGFHPFVIEKTHSFLN